MREFIQAALPWGCMGLALAISLKLLGREKEKMKNGTEEEKAAAQQRSRNMVTGICMGECVGVVIAQTLQIPIAIGLSAGMLLGVLACSRKQ